MLLRRYESWVYGLSISCCALILPRCHTNYIASLGLPRFVFVGLLKLP
jgi:hypothetical protein